MSLPWWRTMDRTSLGTAMSFSRGCRSGRGYQTRGTPFSHRSVTPRKGDKVVVAMSGGVDSSVTAMLLAQQDLDLRAVYMRNWSTLEESIAFSPGSGGAAGCAWQAEWEDVQAVCRHLGGIPVELVDLSREYWVHVFEPALEAWSNGTTPNPDVECNREIKFGALLEKIWGQGQLQSQSTPVHGSQSTSYWLATGHYAQTAWTEPSMTFPVSRPLLLRARDRSKDQTYYLSSVSEAALSRAHFPLAPYVKTEVRAMAHQAGLPTASRKESMGICFVGPRGGSSNSFSGFLDGYIQGTQGNIVDTDGRKVGVHHGLHNFTVGQSARIAGASTKWFVARKVQRDNEIIVVQGKNHPMLLCTCLTVATMHWIWESPPPAVLTDEGGSYSAQVRHRQNEVACAVTLLSGGSYRVTFAEPVHSVSPGQTLALWDKDHCLGSGTITETQTLAEETLSEATP